MKSILNFFSFLPCVGPKALKIIKTILNGLPWIVVVGYCWMGYVDFIFYWALPDIAVGNVGRGFFNFLAFNFLCIMTIWSYFAVAWTPIQKITLDEEEEEDYEWVRGQIDIARSLWEKDKTAKIPLHPHVSSHFCRKCQYYKPERSHHCSWCERCVLKMDHHCPWVGACVGGHNYKYFILLLVYTPLFTGFSAVSAFMNMSDISDYGLAREHIFLMATIAIALSLGVSALLWFHIFLLFTNTTTIEMGLRLSLCNGFSIPESWYNSGTLRNIEEVFGKDKLDWPFPMKNQVPKVPFLRHRTSRDTSHQV